MNPIPPFAPLFYIFLFYIYKNINYLAFSIFFLFSSYLFSYFFILILMIYKKLSIYLFYFCFLNSTFCLNCFVVNSNFNFFNH